MSDYTRCPECRDTLISWETLARFGHCSRCYGTRYCGDPRYFTTRPAMRRKHRIVRKRRVGAFYTWWRGATLAFPSVALKGISS